jgi:hypothetical protein
MRREVDGAMKVSISSLRASLRRDLAKTLYAEKHDERHLDQGITFGTSQASA